MNAPLLVISGIGKSYAVPVLKDIDLQLHKGEVHALMGANGAGKTTLCNIIAGVTHADSGEMQWENGPHCPVSVRDAEDSGIRFVMQELNLVDALSVAENLFLRALPLKRGLIDFKRLFDQADEVLQDMKLHDIDPRQKLSTLGIGHRQLIEIARALTGPCRLLILDEPTAALTDPQIERLFEKIRELRAAGTGIIYISHRMDEIEQIADRVSILRDGHMVTTLAGSEIQTQEIVRLMAGDISQPTHKTIKETRDNRALAVRNLSTRDKLNSVNLDIYYGEVLGIAGLVGSGRTELLRAIFAADQIDGGQMYLGSAAEPLSINSPAEAVQHGICLIPEDRKDQGLWLDQSITSNMTLAALDRYSGPAGWIDDDKEQLAVNDMLKLLDIKCRDSRQFVRELSGGNQQKVSIARNLLLDCKILLFDEPTRGVDIHAKNVIYALLDQLAAQGKAVVIVSSETRELTQVCDHIAVMSNGQLVASFSRGEWTPEKIMEASFSAYVNLDAA